MTDTIRVRFLATIVNGFPFASNDFTSDGGVPLVRIRDLSARDFQTFVPEENVPASAVVRDGDVVIGMDGDFNAVHWSRGPAALNQRVCLLRARGGADSRFIHYAVVPGLQRLNDLAYSTTVKHLSSQEVLDIRVPNRPIGEQRRIADFLDRETAEIDAMDAELDRLIETLRERKSAVSVALFGGPEYGLGTERGRIVGRFRESWKSSRFDVLFPVNDDRNGAAPRGPMLSVSEYRGIEPRRYGERESPRGPDEVTHYRVVRPGQVVANTMWLNHGGIGVSDHVGYTSPDYRVYDVSEEMLPRYAHYLLRSADYRAAFTAIGEGVRPNAQRANTVLLGMLPVPVPPLEEQRRIVAELDEQTARIDEMIADGNRLKELLAERRSTLITEVVTGVKEVPA